MRPSRRTLLRVAAGAFVLGLSLAGILATTGSPRHVAGPAARMPAGGGGRTTAPVPVPGTRTVHGVTIGRSYRHDVSPRLRQVESVPMKRRSQLQAKESESLGSTHRDVRDAARQSASFPARMPDPAINVDGIGYPGVNCYCVPPDTNGEVGKTQYVQLVNQAIRVFSKTTGAPVMTAKTIESLWSGFGGPCQADAWGDPVVVYDQLAERWVVSQFAGYDTPPSFSMTDECVAVSTTSDATGTYNRYAFHLGSDFFDYPKLGVWPDAYYMSMNVFDGSGDAFLGPQPFAFDRAAMIAGNPTASFVTTGITGGPSEDTYLPADLDGSTAPPDGAPNPFVEWPGTGHYRVFRFHVDWGTPANSTFTLAGSPVAAGFTQLCPGSAFGCVPQLGTSGYVDALDGLADRLMFRAAYRNFGDHESLVTNYTVESSAVAGVRWLELRNLTSGTPSVFQESTYQPDTTWRWMGSAAMDSLGDLALGFSASSPDIHPQIRYAGRLAGDPINQLAQGEKTMYAGTGSQLDSYNRWGDYSDMTVDPSDDCTFWYTNEYYSATAAFQWRTRIGSFKFPGCTGGSKTLTVSKSGTGGGTVTSNPAGIDCGSTCSAGFTGSVTLSAAPGSDSTFTGWSGACTGTGDCTVSMSADRAVTATFALKPTKLVITSAETALASGTSRTLTAEVQDSAGHKVTSSAAAVTFTKISGAGTVTGLPATVSASAGVASKSVGGALAGPVTIRATATGLTSDTTTFTVTPGTARKLVFTSATTPLASGTSRTLLVQIRDAAGNKVTSPAHSVAFKKTAGTGTVTSVPATIGSASGQAARSVTGQLAGSITVTASSSGLTSSTTTFTVTAGAAKKLVFTSSTANLKINTVRALTVEVRDSAGNRVTSPAKSVTFAKISGTGAVNAIPATVTSSAGKASRTVKGTSAGSITIRATASGLTAGTTTFSIVR